jgi:hypothetical protein
MSAIKLFIGAALLSCLLLTGAPAATVVQFSNGNVVVVGSNANDRVEITENNQGQLVLVTSDNNTNPVFHEFDNVTGLLVFTFSGTDTISVSGDVTIDGNVLLDFGDFSSIFERFGTANLTVNGDLDIRLGTGFNQINYSGFGSSLVVSDDLTISSAPSSSNIMDWSNCIVGGDFEFVGGHGIDTLFSGTSGVGLMVDGDLLLDMRYDFNGDPTQADFVNLRDSECGGDLTIKTGLGDDQLALVNTSVDGSTLVQTSNGEDSVRISQCELDQPVDVRTGRHNDEVEVVNSTIFSSSYRLYGGSDVITFINSNMGISAFVDGGLGIDTANEFNSQFGKFTLALNVENGNF